MSGVALIRMEHCVEFKEDTEVCVGVFKTYESALVAMAENRREWKEVNTLMYEDSTSMVFDSNEHPGMVSIEVTYKIIPVQKIEA